MKIIKRFYEEDLKNMLMERLDVRPSQITMIHTKKVVGTGEGEHTEPVFYIEVENGE